MGSGQLYKVFGQEQVRSSRKNFFKGQGKLLQKPQADVAAPGPAGAPDQDWHRDFLQVGGKARFQAGPNRSKKSGLRFLILPLQAGLRVVERSIQRSET